MKRFIFILVSLLTATASWAQNNALSYVSEGSNTVWVTWEKDSKGNRIHYSGDIVIPDVVTIGGVECKVTGIAPSTFYGNSGVTSVVIGENVTFIGGEAFRYCSGLESITIPASIDSIGAWAFSNSGLKNVRFEDGETPIKLWDYAGYCIFSSSPLETVYLGRNYISGGRPFGGFKTIKTAYISSYVEKMQVGEFEGCTGLESIYSYRDIPPTCDSRVFKNVNKENCKLYVPEMSIDLYKNAYAWNEFFNVETVIKDILTDQDAAVNGTWFDLNGRRLDNLNRGINILRTKDGKAVKVLTE